MKIGGQPRLSVLQRIVPFQVVVRQSVLQESPKGCVGGIFPRREPRCGDGVRNGPNRFLRHCPVDILVAALPDEGTIPHGKVVQEIFQHAANLDAQRPGGKLLFRRGQPAGNDVVGIHLVERDIDAPRHALLPLPFDPERVEIRDQDSGTLLRNELRNGFAGLA